MKLLIFILLKNRINNNNDCVLCSLARLLARIWTNFLFYFCISFNEEKKEEEEREEEKWT